MLITTIKSTAGFILYNENFRPLSTTKNISPYFENFGRLLDASKNVSYYIQKRIFFVFSPYNYNLYLNTNFSSGGIFDYQEHSRWLFRNYKYSRRKLVSVIFVS